MIATGHFLATFRTPPESIAALVYAFSIAINVWDDSEAHQAW